MLIYCLKSNPNHPLVLERAQAAFNILFDRYASRVHSFLLLKLKNKESVADVFQNVFAKLHKTRAQYNPSIPLQAWIFTISRSACLDELRKQKNQRGLNDELAIELSIAEQTELSSNRSKNSAQGNLSADLESFLQELPDKERQVIQLRILDENSFAEISEKLQISEANARKILSRGLHHLRRILSTSGGNET